jgi:hypothetical protein
MNCAFTSHEDAKVCRQQNHLRYGGAAGAGLDVSRLATEWGSTIAVSTVGSDDKDEWASSNRGTVTP